MQNKRDNQLLIRISSRDKAKLKSLAALKGLSLSEYILRLVLHDISKSEFLKLD